MSRGFLSVLNILSLGCPSGPNKAVWLVLRCKAALLVANKKGKCICLVILDIPLLHINSAEITGCDSGNELFFSVFL